jgi:hypothetical protein
MPAKAYRERVKLCDALQFTGTNQDEMIMFAPDYVYKTSPGEVLMSYKSPVAFVATDWVLKRQVGGVYERLSDADFVALWQPGGGPA